MELKSYFKNSFFKSTAILASGTAFAQLITVISLPFITRLYTPEDFELLAVYLAVLSILGTISCLRFEIAIAIPKTDDDAADLLVSSILSTLLIGTLTFFICFFFPKQISNILGVPDFVNFIYLVPLGVFLVGVYSSLQYWSNRKKRFTIVAKSKIIQAVSGVGTQIISGLSGFTPIGLLVGHLMFGGSGALKLLKTTLKQDSSLLKKVTLKRIYNRVYEYRDYPKYSSVEALSNSAAIQVPVILIAFFAIGNDAGFILLASRVVGAPMHLIGNAISQVYLVQAPEKLRAGELIEFTIEILKPVIYIGIPIIIIMAIFAPSAFTLVFGEEWERSGVLLRWMTPWFILQMLSSPVSMVLHVLNKQRVAMNLQIFGLVIRTSFVFLVGYYFAAYVAEAYAITGAIFYSVYVYIIIISLKETKK